MVKTEITKSPFGLESFQTFVSKSHFSICSSTTMALTIPTTHNPPWTLLTLALVQDIEVKWDAEVGEKGHASYNGVEGTEKVRAELEKNIPGKEVRCHLSIRWMLVITT